MTGTVLFLQVEVTIRCRPLRDRYPKRPSVIRTSTLWGKGGHGEWVDQSPKVVESEVEVSETIFEESESLCQSSLQVTEGSVVEVT